MKRNFTFLLCIGCLFSLTVFGNKNAKVLNLNTFENAPLRSLPSSTTNTPYIPRFNWMEGNTPKNGNDEWKTLSFNGYKTWSRPNYLTNKSISYWQYDGSTQAKAAHDYLFSRPIFLEKGKTYQVDFSVYSIDDTSLNSLEVFMATGVDTTSKVQLFLLSDSIDNTHFLNQQYQFTPQKDSAYYLVFHVQSPARTRAINLEKIRITEVFAKDLEVVRLLAPAEQKIKYSSLENVKIEIKNVGLNPITNELVQVSAFLDAGVNIQEQTTLTLEPGVSTLFTFNQSLNLENITAANGQFSLFASTSMKGDLNSSNDTLTQAMVELLITPPYIPDFGSSTFPTYEEDFWMKKDKNKDKIEWEIFDDGTQRVLSYGGSSMYPRVNIPNSNDIIYSRALSLEANQNYKIQFYSRVNSTQKGSLPLQVGLYTQDGDSLKKITNLFEKEIGSDTYKRTIVEVSPKEQGIYYVGFEVNYANSLDFKIMIDQFAIEKSLSADFSLLEILSPGDKISNLDSLPFGFVVFNNGKKKIENMDIYYQINDETPVKETIDLALESYKEKTVYFSNFVSFTADTLKKISIWGTWIEDKNTINDTLSMSLTNLSSATPRYRADPNAEGWLILDQNQDGWRWEKENGVFRYTPNENDADDYLISRHLSLQADTLYNLFLSTKNTNNSESCNLRISIGQSNHPQTKFEPLADLQNFKRSKAPSVPGLMYYIRVPKDGDYAISLHTYGATQTIEIGSISVAKQNPQNAVIDLAVTQIIAPLEDKIFDTNEQIQVKVKNEGKVTAQGANIYCQVNDKIYSSYLDPNPQITAGKEISFTFSDIDLNEVKTHFIKVFTNQTQDANHSNDTLTFTIRSLAIHNVSLLRIQNPSSGMLSNHEQISVWIKNQGKGNIDAIPLELLIDGEVKAYDTLKQSLAQGDSTLFTFVNSFDFSAEKTYQIQIQSQVFSDINRTQDTVYKSVVSTQIPPDAGVSAILEPTDKAMSSTEKIKIQVKNFSKVDLYDIPLVCTAGKEIIKGSIHRLNALDSIIYEFNDPLDLHLVGTHTLVAYTQVDKDANKANDSCHKIVKSLKTDAALMAILSPKSGLNLEQEAIRICIKNTGELSLKNIAVNYLIDSTQVQEIITDSITPQDSLVYIFDRLYNFSDPKTYLLTVWTSVLNDWNTKNDSLHTSIVCQKAEVDAGVVAITSPVSGKLSTQEKISIIVKNFCNTALCNVAVECNVDALNLKGILNKTIAPHDSVSYTFEQSVDMSTKNKYEIAAYTLLPNDINPDNDLYVLSVETLNLESEDASFALLYPNPTHDRVEIQSKNHIQSIAIFNALGQQVFFKQLQSISQYSLSVKDFKAGIYYMNIKSNLGKIQKLKLIIG